MGRLDFLCDMARAVADIVLPRECIVCGRRLGLDERHLCLSCMADLPLTRFCETQHNPMADKFNARIRPNIPDGVEEAYAWAAALLYYNSSSAFREIPKALKYGGNLSAGRWFADLLGASLAGCPWIADADLVVPVPLHWRRRRSRGFNQAEVIARRVAMALGARCEPGLLRRVRSTRSQARLGMEAKAANVSGAFKAVRVPEARHILLIDDTFTTGSTLAECHRALRQVYPPKVRISVATLSYVG